MRLPLTLLAALLVCGLVFAEKTKRRPLKVACKPLASLAFVGVGLLGSPGSPPDVLLALGLVLGAVGDVALLFAGKAAFLFGLGAFLLGHLAYLAAFYQLAPDLPGAAGTTAVLAVFGATVLRWLWPRLGSMRVPVVVYVAVICGMVVTAVSVLGSGRPGGASVAAGAVMFAVSDVAVARERFVTDSFVNKAWGLPLYYAAQLVIAWTVGSFA